MAELSEWVPMFLTTPQTSPAGVSVSATEWNSRWLLNQTQGDDTAAILKQAIDELYASVWADHAPAYMNTDFEHSTPQTLAAYLVEQYAAAVALGLQVTGNSDMLLEIIAGTQQVGDAANLAGAPATDYALAADLTTLEGIVSALSAGTISAFSHNDIGNRDVAEAHPISAITGLASAIAAIPTTHASFADKNNAASHTAAAIEFVAGTSLTAKLAAIDATIANLTGDMSEIAHNDLASRTTADAHPISAITGLQAALDAKGSAATLAALVLTVGDLNTALGALTTVVTGKQKQITASTSAPSGGADGDVWIQHG